MNSENARAQLLERYAQVINQEDLRELAEVRGLSGIFAGSVCESYFHGGPRVMVVGREPRGWDEETRDGKKRAGLTEASTESDLKSYLETMMQMHEKTVLSPPPTSKFFHFYKRVQRDIAKSPAPGSVAWGNLLCISHKKGSAVVGLKKAQDAHLKKIFEWSRALLRAQIEVLQPQFIFFVTSPSYDRYLKAFIDIDETDRKVHVPKELWQFKANGAHAFRTRHPRILTSSAHRKRAITLALGTAAFQPAQEPNL